MTSNDDPRERPRPLTTFTPPDVSHVQLRVVYADAAIAVVIKPPELLSCPGTSTPNWDSVTVRAQALFPDATGPLLVHRLDSPTSGLMVLALTIGAQRALSQAFAKRLVSKRYDAICEPISSEHTPLSIGASGTITLPLRLDWPRRPLQMVDPVRGKSAETEWQVLGTHRMAPGALHLTLVPVTGRTHQLRVHLARGLGYPIVGDRLYGRDHEAACAKGTRLHLHASHLAFSHPSDGRPMLFDDTPDFDAHL